MKNEYAIMKAGASVLVVIGHVIIFYSTVGGVVEMPLNTLLNFLMNFIYSFHMPLFMFVSGAVYHKCISMGKYKNMLEFVAKKFRRIMIPYFVCGILYVTPVMLLLGITDLSPAEYILRGILCCRDSRHLWFLWALFFVAVCIRFLQFFIEQGKVCKFLLLAFCLGVWYLSWQMTDMFGINSIMRYLFWYYAGYLFDWQKHRIDSIIEGKVWIPFLSFLVIIFYLWLGNNLWVGLVSAWAGIILVYCLAFYWKDYLWENKVYQILQRDYFGIYLAHPMIIYFCFYYFRGIMLNPYITSIIVTVIALVISILFTELLQRAKREYVLRRYGKVHN